MNLIKMYTANSTTKYSHKKHTYILKLVIQQQVCIHIELIMIKEYLSGVLFKSKNCLTLLTVNVCMYYADKWHFKRQQINELCL